MNSRSNLKTFRPPQLPTINAIKEVVQNDPHLKPRVIQDMFERVK